MFQEERKDRFAREEVEGILWGGSEWGSDWRGGLSIKVRREKINRMTDRKEVVVAFKKILGRSATGLDGMNSSC